MSKTTIEGANSIGLLGNATQPSSIDFSDILPQNTIILHVGGQENITIPSAESLTEASFTQQGSALILGMSDGQNIQLEDYFNQNTPPNLTSCTGHVLPPSLVDSFLQNKSLRYAQDDQIISDATDNHPIGLITESSGETLITRVNGQQLSAQNGTLIFQGDIVETMGSGAVNILFIDESSFAISNNARMTIDEFIFDATSLEGLSNFSVLQGAFVYSSGSIGSEDPDDVHIETPIGSIGIRGTVIAGTIDGQGPNSEITIVEGAIIIRNETGEYVLSKQFDTVHIAGMSEPIIAIGPLTADQLAAKMHGVQGVAGGFFNTLQHTAQLQSGTADEVSGIDDSTEGETPPQSAHSNEEQGEPAITLTPQPPAATAPALSIEPLSTESTTGKSTSLLDTQQPTSSIQSSAPMATLAVTEPSLTDPNAITPADADADTQNDLDLPPTRINLNAPDSANNTHVISGLPTGAQYGAAVTNIYNNTTGFDDISFVRGQVSSAGNFVTLAGSAILLGSTIDLSAATYQDITDSFANTTRENATSIISGDFNGDGINELLIGSPKATNGVSLDEDDGMIYAVNIDGTSATPGFGGYTGFVTNDAAQQYFGHSIANVGDMNNDGFVDLAIASPGANTTNGGVRLALNGTDLSNASFLDYNGQSPLDYIGGDVSSLGDMNGDGYDDFAFGVYQGTLNGGQVDSALDSLFIVTGGSNPLFFDDLSETLQINGAGASGFGRSVSGAGDVNGDGFSDVLVSNGDSALKLIMGQDNLPSTTTAESAFTQFNLDVAASGYIVESMASAGDFNADGYDDFAVMMRNGSDIKISIILGDPSLSGLNADLQYLEDHAEIAYMIDYSLSATPASGYTMEFTHGDINGDGFDDLVITDPQEEQAFLIEGGRVGQTISDYLSGEALTANADGQILTGTAQNDTMHQNSHTELTFKGGAGDDNFYIDNAQIGGVAQFNQINGGGGNNDRIILDGTQGSIDLSAIGRNEITRIEAIDIGGGNDLILSVKQIFDMLKSSDNGALKITALDLGSTLTIESGGNHTDDANGLGNALENLSPVAGIAPTPDGGYDRYDIGNYQLFVDQDLTIVTDQVI
tara:strand:+ start:73732 stop:77004 length:3273 start_codon:yes stop_codon:yes gene_type:complete